MQKYNILMANIKVGIVEDDPLAALNLTKMLKQIGYQPTAAAACYQDAMAMVENERPDILLVDITLVGEKDGIDVCSKIKADYDLPFIFLTANADVHTLERAKKITPQGYMIKPPNKNELFTSIEICLNNYNVAKGNKTDKENEGVVPNDYLFVKQTQNFHKIRIDDIIYLQSDNVYIYVHTRDNKLVVRSTIPDYLRLIDKKYFFKVHRSYAVNINHIDTISADSITVNGAKIPLSKSYRDELLSALRLG